MKNIFASDGESEVTRQLRAWRAGEAGGDVAIDAQIYQALKQLASAHANDRGGINPTALVHEAVVRLLDGQSPWQSRSHFYALAALHMRAILVDHARAQQAQKRGGTQLHISFDAPSASAQDQNIDHDSQAPDTDLACDAEEFLALHEALNDLAKSDPRTAAAVELVYFGGLTAAQVAECMGHSVATVERDLSFAKLWLRRELQA